MNIFDKIFDVKWEEYPKNPIIKPVFPSPVIADPTLLPPGDAPDGKWHLFAHSIFGIHHFISSNGITWKRLKGVVCHKSLRPFLFKENTLFYLFYEKIFSFFPFRSRIEFKLSKNLIDWEKSKIVLSPSLPWHKKTCGNPCVIKDNNEYKLYYSAALVYLEDCKFSEPEHIGIAVSNNIAGSYRTFNKPIISPDKNDSYRNLGAGAIKVLKTNKGYVGFENGIYIGAKGHSHSAIRALRSEDGYLWHGFDKEPILMPGRGWKKSHVYALDIKIIEDKMWLYFNARNGWLIGKECIGLCIGTI